MRTERNRLLRLLDPELVHLQLEDAARDPDRAGGLGLIPAVGGEGSGSGVANFEAAILGQFLRSHEDITGVPKCKGLARPVFEMHSSQASQGAYALMPGASPGRRALWLFPTKKIEVPGNGFVFLG